jgi:hypothetical protein
MKNSSIMFMFRAAALCSAFIIVSGCVGRHVIRSANSSLPKEEREREVRRRLNEHIIAINSDGLAIDPYTYRYEGKFAGAGYVKPHFGGVINLQERINTENGVKALRAMGYNDLQITNLTTHFAGQDAFVFRDVVLSNMFAQAKASRRRITLFIHGGLNNLDDAIKRAEEMLLNVENPELPTNTYPIFVCWPSGLGSAYWQHLAHVRNAVPVKKESRAVRLVNYSAIPIYISSDLAASVARLPRVLTDLVRVLRKTENPYTFGDVVDGRARYYGLRYVRYRYNAIAATNTPTFDEWVRQLEPFERKDLTNLCTKLNKRLGREDSLSEMVDYFAGTLASDWTEIQKSGLLYGPPEVTTGAYQTTAWDKANRAGLSVLLSPTKIGIAGALSATGVESWNMMWRRVEAMYNHEASFRPAFAVPGEDHSYEETNLDLRNSLSPGVGAMAVFFRALEDWQSNRALENPVDVFGHSMGCIVLNRAVQYFPKVRLHHIVYMAAACSVKDFALSVIPYLQTPAARDARFYNLCLNPRAEERERSASDIVPRGSLLVWIDTFLQRPSAFEDRVFGHFENALLGSHMFPASVQQRIHITAFPAGSPKKEHGNLQTHGSFTHYAFWESDFYQQPGYWATWETDPRRPSSDPAFTTNRESFRLLKVKNGVLEKPKTKVNN